MNMSENHLKTYDFIRDLLFLMPIINQTSPNFADYEAQQFVSDEETTKHYYAMIDAILTHYGLYIEKKTNTIEVKDEEIKISKEIGLALTRIMKSVDSLYNNDKYCFMIKSFFEKHDITVEPSALLPEDLTNYNISVVDFYVNNKKVAFYTFKEISHMSFDQFSHLDLKLYLPVYISFFYIIKLVFIPN